MAVRIHPEAQQRAPATRCGPGVRAKGFPDPRLHPSAVREVDPWRVRVRVGLARVRGLQGVGIRGPRIHLRRHQARAIEQAVQRGTGFEIALHGRRGAPRHHRSMEQDRPTRDRGIAMQGGGQGLCRNVEALNAHGEGPVRRRPLRIGPDPHTVAIDFRGRRGDGEPAEGPCERLATVQAAGVRAHRRRPLQLAQARRHARVPRRCGQPNDEANRSDKR